MHFGEGLECRPFGHVLAQSVVAIVAPAAVALAQLCLFDDTGQSDVEVAREQLAGSWRRPDHLLHLGDHLIGLAVLLFVMNTTAQVARKMQNVYKARTITVCCLPFANVEHSRSLYDHRVQFVSHALLRHMLQWPVPVVVVVRAEHWWACNDLTPRAAIERKSHIVLAAHPWRDLHLNCRQFDCLGFCGTLF